MTIIETDEVRLDKNEQTGALSIYLKLQDEFGNKFFHKSAQLTANEDQYGVFRVLSALIK